MLPVYLRVSKDVIALQALGGTALLLVWLYVMANVVVFGAEVNWFWHRRPDAGGAGGSGRAGLTAHVPQGMSRGLTPDMALWMDCHSDGTQAAIPDAA